MTPTTMQIIAGQNVKANSKPAPTGFGFGSGHNPTAAAKMMVRSGAAPMTSKTSPTLTHIDFRYSRMDKCGLTVKLNGRAEAPDWRRGRTISSSARGAQPPAHHGPFQRWLEDAPTSLLCARGFFSANRNWPTQRTPIAQRRHSRDKAQPLAPALHAGLTGRPRAHKRKR